jgi:hypothetical protein
VAGAGRLLSRDPNHVTADRRGGIQLDEEDVTEAKIDPSGLPSQTEGSCGRSCSC